MVIVKNLMPVTVTPASRQYAQVHLMQFALVTTVKDALPNFGSIVSVSSAMNQVYVFSSCCYHFLMKQPDTV